MRASSRALFRLGSALESWHVSLVLCWWHMLTLYLILAENALIYGMYPDEYGQFILFAFAIVIAFVPVRTVSEGFAVAVVFVANLFVICEQVAFKFNGVHTRPSMAEQEMELRTLFIMLGSFIAELDAVFFSNLAGLTASGFVIQRWAQASNQRKILLPPVQCGSRSTKRYLFHRFTMLWLAAWLLNTPHFILSLPKRGQKQIPHPCLIFLSDLVFGSREPFGHMIAAHFDTMTHDLGPDTMAKNSMLYPELVDAPIYGKQLISPKEQTWMAEIREAILADRSNNRGPRVIVSVVLESSGSANVFPEKDGIFDSSLTPTLATMQAEGGVVFTNHHDYYPSTTRSHVPMFTGGPTMTMGSLSDQLSHSYEGPTLMEWMKNRGARTGLFAASDLDFENLATWYRHLGWDRFHHYGIMDEAFKKKYALNSWGGTDSIIYELATKWIEEELAISGNESSATYFLHLLPDATHHPYSVPVSQTKHAASLEDFLPKLSDSLFRYKRALRYTDMALGRMRSRLDAMGLASHTLFIITGDHGEAFGSSAGHHSNNFLHKNHIFEENIRSFLLLYGPALRKQTKNSATPEEYKISRRVSRVIDVFPTVASFVSGNFSRSVQMLRQAADKAQSVSSTASSFSPGQNLLSQDWSLRLAFFHRMGNPPEWGILDGQYKFIEVQQDFSTRPQIDTSRTAVYNIVEDPGERTNLALLPKMQDRIAKWRSAAVANFWVAHCAFTTRLADYEVGHLKGSGCAALQSAKRKMKEVRASSHLRHASQIMQFQMPSATKSGPKAFMFGHKDETGSFHRSRTLSRNSKKIIAFTEWIPFEKKKNVVMEWTPLVAGDREHSKGNKWRWTIEAGWHTTYFNIYPHPLPMVPGTWELIVWSDGGKGTRVAIGRQSILVV